MAVIASEGRLWQVRHDVMLECNKRICRVVTDCAFQAGARREALFHFDTCEGDKREKMLRISPPTSPLELTVETIKHSCIMPSLFPSTLFFYGSIPADSTICIFLKIYDSWVFFQASLKTMWINAGFHLIFSELWLLGDPYIKKKDICCLSDPWP